MTIYRLPQDLSMYNVEAMDRIVDGCHKIGIKCFFFYCWIDVTKISIHSVKFWSLQY